MIAQVIRRDRMGFLSQLSQTQRFFGGCATKLNCSRTKNSGSVSHGKRFLQISLKGDSKFGRNSDSSIPPPSTSTASSTVSPQWNFQLVSLRKGQEQIKGHCSSGPQGSHNPSFSPMKWSSYAMPAKSTLKKQDQDANMQEEDSKMKLQKAAQDAKESKKQVTTENSIKKKRKRTIRPRKALITLSTKAISHLQGLLDQPEPKLIRIGVKNRGCSGLTYDLQYITEPGKFDEVVEQDGVKVFIDSKALFSIVGSEMDWVDDKLSSRFIFKNPNSKGTCGCGESFMV
ncbi:hypothetical protein HG535_0E05570 [Zygotorulaspora mrakii]|uniref:Iron-sulfur assembly protein 1 n=1 Tax=Zygotorulaspora mrakii TaxID=42260 RepID=A0A7H9B4T2_ZYGMR|nr:uncharacterized protein HG535_0E05570 [Zygotorulaspora mrakii]QLG73473.1 hypothetical protein HG535_0E05570 [Zygotorulaspora mrakii]